MNEKNLKFIFEEGLASYMSQTRWCALANELTSNRELEPKVRVKYLRDKDPMPGFSYLDWEWVKFGESSCIEWMDIDPIRKERLGKLIPDKETDISNFIEKSLKNAKVKYSLEQNKYRVWGYAATQPEFV